MNKKQVSGMGMLNVVFIINIILGILLVGSGILSIITKFLPRAVRVRGFEYVAVTGREAQLFGIFYIIVGLLLIILGILLPIKLGGWFSHQKLEDK